MKLKVVLYRELSRKLRYTVKVNPCQECSPGTNIFYPYVKFISDVCLYIIFKFNRLFSLKLLDAQDTLKNRRLHRKKNN